MKFVLASKTQNEGQPDKVQLQFRYVAPEVTQPAPQPNGQPAYIPQMNYVNFGGTFDKAEADLYEIGATYELSLTKVVEPTAKTAAK